MARQKKNNIKEAGVIPELNSDGDIILKSELEEELLTENLSQSLMALTKEFGSLSIEVKDYSPREMKERAPVYKYVCEICGSEIKSKAEDLIAIHSTCSTDERVAKFLLKE